MLHVSPLCSDNEMAAYQTKMGQYACVLFSAKGSICFTAHMKLGTISGSEVTDGYRDERRTNSALSLKHCVYFKKRYTYKHCRNKSTDNRGDVSTCSAVHARWCQCLHPSHFTSESVNWDSSLACGIISISYIAEKNRTLLIISFT